MASTKDALEVVLTWDGNAQRQELYAQPRPVWVGEVANADFMLPREVWAQDFVLAEPDAGGWVMNVPAGAAAYADRDGEALDLGDATVARRLALAPGVRAVIEVGGFAFHVRATEAPKVTAAPVAFDLRSWGFVLGSVAFHGLMLGAFLMMPPRASAISMDLTASQRDYLQYHLAAIVPPEPEVAPLPEAGAAEAGGAEGQPHEGSQGTAGMPDRRPTGGGTVQRRGEDAATQIPREAVAQAGILGVLPSLLGDVSAVSSPFGRENALAGDAQDRWGIPGLNDGLGAGTWGFDTTGPGHGTCRPGQDCTAGTVGVGDGDMIGTGTCSQAQFREIAGREGRARAVAMCRGDGPGIGDAITDRGRTSRVPRLISRPPEVTPGGLTREQVRRTVTRHLNEVRFCYEQALISNPELAGRVSVQFLITQSGTVQAVSAPTNTTNHAQLAACVTGAVRRWDFPQAPSPTFVREYPFRFEMQ